MSKRKVNTLQDSLNLTLRDKIRKYPSIIFGKEIDEENYQFLLDEAKKFRDSLMHPSPFSAPEKFGGYDKLEKLYNLKIETVYRSISEVIGLIDNIESLKGRNQPIPIWLPGIKKATNDLLLRTTKSSGP